MSEKRKAGKVKWMPTGFGLVATFDTPDDCGVVIVCVNGGSHYQLHPVAVRLPGQIYHKDCVRWLKEYDAREITIVPANHKHYVELGTCARHAKSLAKGKKP